MFSFSKRTFSYNTTEHERVKTCMGRCDVVLNIMAVCKILFTILILWTVQSFCEAKRRGRQTIAVIPSEAEVDEGSGDAPESYLRSSRDFTEWSGWSRCRRNCKQKRIQRCFVPEVCGGRNKKQTRPCLPEEGTSQCNLKELTGSGQGREKGRERGRERGRKRGRQRGRKRGSEIGEGKIRSNVLEDLNSYLYSRWTEWSGCTDTCFSTRTKTCLDTDLCGRVAMFTDYKVCYPENSDVCQKRSKDLAKYSKMRNGTLKGSIHPLANIDCGIADNHMKFRITGGFPAIKGAWPWQVMLLNEDLNVHCGGVLLTEQWILTAAHCVREVMYARAGEHDVSIHEDTEQDAVIENAYMHPNYNPDTVESDLALLQVDYPYYITPFVRPICLPVISEELEVYTRPTILGWGKRRNDSYYGTNILHEADVPIVSTKKCKESYRQMPISKKMICAGYETGLVDACRGDSGGPLMGKRKDGTWGIFGITSYGEGCGEAKKYGVYTNVLRHLPWIKRVIQLGNKITDGH